MKPNPYQSPEAESQSTPDEPETAGMSLGQAAWRGAKTGTICAGIAMLILVFCGITLGSYADATTTVPPSELTFSFVLQIAFWRFQQDFFSIVNIVFFAAIFGSLSGAAFKTASVWSRRKRKAQK